MKTLLTSCLFFVALFCVQTAFGQKTASEDILTRFEKADTGESGYKNQRGQIIIPAGKYLCFSDEFRTYAIVMHPDKGLVGIDRKENILYNVFEYDNGPDYVKDGLFRIVKDKKIGYADAVTGKIIIQPQFPCAWPFEKGKAKVSLDCGESTDGEYSSWDSDKWFYINKQGKNVGPAPKD